MAQLPFRLHRSQLTIATVLTLVTAICLLLLTYLFGNHLLFLYLNADLGGLADVFFHYFTYLGEAIPWIAALILILSFQKKAFWLLLFCFLISTLFAQGIKNSLPPQPRPTKAIADHALIHTVKGVELHEYFSFPSGHTTTAFTIFLLAAALINQKWVIPVGFIYALLIAYSRIYLAQHFPLDLAGGMISATATIYLSIYLSSIIGKDKHH